MSANFQLLWQVLTWEMAWLDWPWEKSKIGKEKKTCKQVLWLYFFAIKVNAVTESLLEKLEFMDAQILLLLHIIRLQRKEVASPPPQSMVQAERLWQVGCWLCPTGRLRTLPNQTNKH